MSGMLYQKLAENFTYNPNTGVISRAGSNSPVGSLHKSTGYLRVWISGKEFGAHRVAWILHYGSPPSGLIDHINGIKTDNRIANLRDVTHSENAQNSLVRNGYTYNMAIRHCTCALRQMKGTRCEP